jgi:hypothetical protein
MKTAAEIYGVNASKEETCIIKTISGNYVYAHILSGNSVQKTRVYIPKNREDKLTDNTGLFHILFAKHKKDSVLVSGLLFGEEVMNACES